MMCWYGQGLGTWGSTWGYVLMAANMVLFWALVIAGIVALVRYLTRTGRTTGTRPTAEQLLAERFARGEIDEQEYHRRSEALHSRPTIVEH